jgi:hypothetical protein
LLNQLISKGTSLNKFYGNEYSCINSLNDDDDDECDDDDDSNNNIKESE